MPSKSVLIYADDDDERLYELRVTVDVAQRALTARRIQASVDAPARFGDEPASAIADLEADLDAARRAFDEAVDEAAERAEAWNLHSIGFEAWGSLVAAHRPRKVTEGEGEDAREGTDPADAEWGVDTSKFGKALLLFADAEDPEHRTVTSIGGEPAAGVLAKRLRRLSRGQFDTLWVTAYHLNTGGIADPKAARYSTGMRSDED